MENEELLELKAKYNKSLARNKKAEVYFKTHTVKECLKYLDLFNEVTKELSGLCNRIEIIMGRLMNSEEKIIGFKEVWNERNK